MASMNLLQKYHYLLVQTLFSGHEYGLLSIWVSYSCTVVCLFASFIISLRIHWNSWPIRQDDVWEESTRTPKPGLGERTDFFLGARTYFFFLAEYRTAFTMKWLQAVRWHKQPQNLVWKRIWLLCSIYFCFDSSIYMLLFHCLGCSWEQIWCRLLMCLVLVYWKITELTFCVKITLSPILVKHFMCQVWLLVPFQHLRRVGEQTNTGLILMLK